MFEIAEELNRIGQSILADAKVTFTSKGPNDPKLLTMLLLIRTLSNFQGVILLAERGMIVEARTLGRCCYENAYVVSALQKDGDEFVKAMLSDEMHVRKGTSRWFLDDPARLEHVAGGEAQLKKNIENIEAEHRKTVGYKFDQIAERAGIADLYIWYKQLSWDAAHPSLQALGRYFDADEQGGNQTLRWGPDCKQEEVGDTLSLCLSAVFCVWLVCAEQLGAPQGQAAASALWQRFKSLILAETA
jgi:hypothetical protein